VFLFVVAGVAVGDYLDSRYIGLKARYWAYQRLATGGPRGVEAPNVVLVKIGDGEFWRGRPNRRTPIKRDYLADLLGAVADAYPAVIALDFDLDAPIQDARVPEGMVADSQDYVCETKKLIGTVDRVAQPPLAIVLPQTLDRYSYRARTRDYLESLTIFGGHRFSSAVKFGFINFRWDLRHVPLSSVVRQPRRRILSFSRQIAIAKNGSIHVPSEQDGALYGKFMNEDQFYSVLARDVLANPRGQWRSLVAHRIALIGSLARVDGVGRGSFIDNFDTPVGEAPGVVVHANYVEAFLDRRVLRVLPEWLTSILEGLISFLVSVLFVLQMATRKKMLWFTLLASSTVLASWFCLQNLGVFFDPFFPSLLVIGHAVTERGFDRVREWKRDSRELERLGVKRPQEL
jgi:CHASE2 domain-containing sensor protein